MNIPNNIDKTIDKNDRLTSHHGWTAVSGGEYFLN